MTPPRNLREILDAQMTEADWMDQVIGYAHLRLWSVAHFRPARTARGWRTPVGADGAGFPDLVLVRDRVVFAELKAEKGKLTRDQETWQVAIRASEGEFYVWRPRDWSEVEKVLA